VEGVGGAGGENDVVDIQEEVGRGMRSTKDEEGGVTFGGHKTERVQKRGEAKKPSMWCLLETI
jgi:hypothetical protein